MIISFAVIAIFNSVVCQSQQLEFMAKMNSGTPIFHSNTTNIPFQLHGHKIFIKVNINNSKALNFVFDTGAITVIDQMVAREMDITSGIEIPSMQSMSKAYISKDKLSFHFGNIQVNDFIPIISKLPEGNNKEPGIAGLIGSDILRFFCISIDYQNKNLILSKKVIDFGGISYRVNMTKQFPLGFPLLESSIDNNPVKVMIDTGSPFSIVCPAIMIDSSGIFSDYPFLKSKGWFMKWPSVSSESNYLVQIKQLRFGSLEITDMPAFLAELPMKSKNPLLGYSFFNNFITTIDYPNNEVIFWPVSRPFYLTRYFAGFTIKEVDQKVIIKGIWENSPADQAGIQVGDELLQLCEHYVKESSIKSLKTILDDDSIIDVTIVIKRKNIEQQVKLKKEHMDTMLRFP